MAKSFDFNKMVSGKVTKKEEKPQTTPTTQATQKAQKAQTTQKPAAPSPIPIPYPKEARERFNTSVHPEIKKLAKMLAAKEEKSFADLLEEMILERWERKK